MAAMPILNFISIGHMFRKPVTDKDFSQIQIHECHVDSCVMHAEKR